MDRYIMANIKLPLKINEDGTYSTMVDNIEISFSNFEGSVLAEKAIDEEENKSFELNDLISKIVFPKSMIIYKSEIKPKKTNPRTHHMSFKNQKQSAIVTSRFTVKAR